MTHVHHCPDCQTSWDCGSPDCEECAVYLCLICFKGLIYPHCQKAIAGADGSALREEIPNQSDR
jgi:hypothetical protein